MNRIDKVFKQLKAAKKKAFIAFITAGYPDLKTTGQLIRRFDEIGVDIIELGVPFTDPMADGSIIQQASQVALKGNVRLIDILNLVRRLRKEVSVPICLMSYYNPIFCFGDELFIRQAVASGVDGVIIPDLPPEEAKAFIRQANKSALDNICFIAPTSSLERIKFIAKVARGFIYYVSLTGVTGARSRLPEDLIRKLKSIKKITRKPLCVGFGVSRRQQVKAIGKVADGVIVGSAIVKKIKENLGQADLVEKTVNFVRVLSGVQNSAIAGKVAAPRRVIARRALARRSNLFKTRLLRHSVPRNDTV
ncbi:MAG: tryptophan synthase subunit alpha [Candidatus Omnitrophota bacterium]